MGNDSSRNHDGDFPSKRTPDEHDCRAILADRLNTLPKVVFSKTLSEAPWGKWSPVRVVSSDPVEEIQRLKAGDGKDLVLWGSLTLAQQLIAAALVDEYHLQICPTIVGGGRPLFPALPGYASLKRVEVRNYDTGVTFLRYERLESQ